VRSPDVHADLFQDPVNQHAGLAHRALRIISKGALDALPLLAQASDVVEQTDPRATALGGAAR